MSVNFQSSNIDFICIKEGGGWGGGGVQAYNFGKLDFERWVEEGHVPTFLGWFWVRVYNFAHVRPRSKNKAKNRNLHIRR